MSMTTVDALKDVYTELGGNAATVAGIQTDAEMIEALSALVGSTIELPAVDAEDNGKVLKVIDGAWNKGVDNTLPSVTSEDEGKTLLVDNEGAWSVEDVPKELPSVTSEDEGKVLFVNSSGAWAAGTSSGNDIEYFEGSISSNTFTLSNGKTKKDIMDAIIAGKIVYLKRDAVLYNLFAVDITSGYAKFGNIDGSSNNMFITSVQISGNDASTTGSILTKTIT